MVSTPLKNIRYISQIGSFPQKWRQKMFETTTQFCFFEYLDVGNKIYNIILEMRKSSSYNTKSEENLGWWDEEIYRGSIPVIPPVRFGVWMVCFRGPVIPPNSFGVWKPIGPFIRLQFQKLNKNSALNTKNK